MKLLLLLMMFYLFVPSHEYQQYLKRRYKIKYNGARMYTRMIDLMKTVHNEGRQRLTTLNPLRFMFEETPFYEMGYLMGEIVERYRKMVIHSRRRMTWRSAYIHDLVRRTQVLQYLYFEVYNLCRMLNQIELKYKTDFEFQDIHSEIPMQEIIKHNENLRIESIFIEKERQRKLKKIRKQKKKFQRLNNTFEMYHKPKRERGYWPIEYGWDIGSEW